MNCIVKDDTKTKKEIEFPILLREDTGTIWLVTRSRRGGDDLCWTVLGKDDPNFDGHRNVTYDSYYNKECGLSTENVLDLEEQMRRGRYIIFEGTVTLSNS